MIKILAELGLLDISVDKYNHLALKDIQMNMDCSEILFNDIHYRKLESVMKDKIRKTVKSVKKDCV